MEDWLDLNPDPVHVKREREKARALRQTDWWRAQLQKGVCHYCGRQVGAANLVDPWACEKIIRDLPETMQRYRITDLNEIIGGAH